jgi:ubiquilin
MSNPDMMRNMITSNPQLQAMMDANPQIRHVLNDPAVLRQVWSVDSGGWVGC